MIKKFTKFIKGYTVETILTPLFVIMETLCEVATPLFMSDLIDKGLETGDIDYVVKMGLFMLGTALLSLFCGIMCGIMNARAGSGFACNLRKALFAKVQTYSFSNIDKFSTGSIITRVTSDTENIQMAFQMLIRMFIRAPLMMIVATIMAVRLSKTLSVIYLIAIPVLLIGLVLVMAKAAPLFQIMMDKYDNLNIFMQENLTGIRAVKSFVREENEIKKFNTSSRDLRDFSVKAEKIIIWTTPIMMFVMYAVTIAIYWFGGQQIVAGQFSAGKLMTFLTYSSMILSSLMMVAMMSSMGSMAVASGRRLIEILEETPEISSPENAVTEVKDGSVDFDDVDFRYSDTAENNVLSDVTLHIKSGEVIGVFGATGSSKSSLVQLIPRLYDASQGTVKVGGVNVKDYDVEVLRDSVAMVLQKNVLFSGTIRENLLWGNENATQEDIEKACKMACCHDFIMSFPEGYETMLEQGGVNLSGGQRQRVCIARALLKNPKIIIMDDSTSAVDTQTDATIREGFKNYIPDVTKIIIAQRISSIEHADRILVLDEGRVSAFGTHEELMECSPIYSEIYTTQVEGGKA